MERGNSGAERAQSSFELLITLAFGLAILLPLVVIAFIQLANTNTSLATVESQQAASKLASVATLIGSEGPPAKQLVQIQVPPNVKFVYVGNLNNTIGHEIIFAITAPTGLSYVTAYTPVNVSGSLGGISATGTYLINVTALSVCPINNLYACVYMSPKV